LNAIPAQEKKSASVLDHRDDGIKESTREWIDDRRAGVGVEMIIVWEDCGIAVPFC